MTSEKMKQLLDKFYEKSGLIKLIDIVVSLGAGAAIYAFTAYVFHDGQVGTLLFGMVFITMLYETGLWTTDRERKLRKELESFGTEQRVDHDGPV